MLVPSVENTDVSTECGENILVKTMNKDVLKVIRQL